MPKPKFDPYAPFEEVKKPKFDPSQPFEDAKDQTPSGLETDLRQGVAGLTAGFDDEIVGGIGAAGRMAGVKNLGSWKPFDSNSKLEFDSPTLSKSELVKAYVANRDSARQDKKRDEKHNPNRSMVANVAGSVVSPVNKLGLVTGGAAVGLGLSDADLTKGDVKNAAIDTAMGATIAKALQLGGENLALPAIKGAKDFVGKHSPKVAEFLKKKAEQKATRALGRPTPTQSAKMQATGQDREIGRTLLDEGAIPILGTPDRIAGRVSNLKEKAGQEVGKLVDMGGDAKLVDAQKIAIDILDSPELSQMRKTPGMESTVAAIEKQVETLANNGQMTLKEAQKLRQGIDKSINFNKADPNMRGTQEALYQQRSAIRNSMNEGINSLPDAPGKDALLNANRKYGNLSKAEDLVTKEQARNATNRAVSLSDTVLSAGGAATGNPVAAIGLGALNKAGRTFGNSIQARTYDTLSKALKGSSSGAKYLPVLDKAAARGEKALETTLKVLSRDPEFQKAMQSIGQPDVIRKVASDKEERR